MYFNYGFNEEFIELIDTEQTIRYNRSAILVKHIRSTTHLFCKLYLDTTCVGVRVQILIKKGSLEKSRQWQFLQRFIVDFNHSVLLDNDLKKNEYLDMDSNERDVYQIAFQGTWKVSIFCQIGTI